MPEEKPERAALLEGCLEGFVAGDPRRVLKSAFSGGIDVDPANVAACKPEPLALERRPLRHRGGVLRKTVVDEHRFDLESEP